MLGCSAVLFLLALTLSLRAGAGSDARFEETIKKTLTILDRISTTLGTVKDEDSAKKAKPDLRKATGDFLAVRKESETIPPPSKNTKDRLAKEYKTKLEDANKKLQTEVNRVEALPGGHDVLEDVRTIMKKDESAKEKEKEKK